MTATKKTPAKSDTTTPAVPEANNTVSPDEAVNDPAFLAAAANQPAPVLTAPTPAPTDPLAGMPTIAVPNSDGVPVPVAFDPADQVIAADKAAAEDA